MEHVHARAAADARVAALAAAQHGVVDLDALRAAGLGLGAINHRVRAGRLKDARLTMLGYRVVRFTYRRLVDERDVVVATLLRLLATWSPPVKLSP